MTRKTTPMIIKRKLSKSNFFLNMWIIPLIIQNNPNKNEITEKPIGYKVSNVT